ncbi:putative serine/threonine-protein kinase-like protein CCR3 [Hordeum vulgare]|nr:putative serine/threonine-protein kinase-like protein CCR3 [Hordeum vulgare]
MTLWSELSEVATVAQLVGADVVGLISRITQAAETARQNRRECQQLARRVLIISRLLPLVEDLEAARQMAGLGDTLREAHELLQSCQRSSAAYHFFMAGRKAVRFREMQNKIDFYLLLFPVTSHIGIARRLDRIYKLLDTTGAGAEAGGEPSTLPQSTELQSTVVVVEQEVVPYEIRKFTFAEIVAATDYFARVLEIGTYIGLYRGRLHDGREVTVKRNRDCPSYLFEELFRTEMDILPRLQHKHIVRLLGSCVTAKKDKRLSTIPQQKKKRLLSWWRKEPKEPEWLIVYDCKANGTLFDHLLHDRGPSVLSPVTVSWKMRIEVLLGVSRAVEHMHCHANPPIIHRCIKSQNILFDATWVPLVSGFGSSVVWDMASSESGMTFAGIHGTFGYLDPEYVTTCCMKPTNDVYSLGIVMLEVLTGEMPSEEFKQGGIRMASFAVPIIEAGNIRGLLDTRPVPEPTPGQLRALEHVAQTARCCVKEEGKDRPTISDIVANLETALGFFCGDEPSSVHESPQRVIDVPWAAFPSQTEPSEITLAEDPPGGGGHEKCASDPGGSRSSSIDATQHLKITSSV